MPQTFDASKFRRFFGNRILKLGLPVAVIASFVWGGLPSKGPIRVATAEAKEDVGSGRLGRASGLPVPRFVSLSPEKARMRVGPGFNYPIAWVYHQKYLPMEVIAEYGNWRKVRDYEGQTGWMHWSILSGLEIAAIAPWSDENLPLFAAPDPEAAIVARMEPRALVHLLGCADAWCSVRSMSLLYEGYMKQKKLWGTFYAEEQDARDELLNAVTTFFEGLY